MKRKNSRIQFTKDEHLQKEKGKPDSESLSGPKGHVISVEMYVNMNKEEKRKLIPSSDLKSQEDKPSMFGYFVFSLILKPTQCQWMKPLKSRFRMMELEMY